MDGDVILKPPSSPVGSSPWSQFHSKKLPLTKLPGTPVRQYQAPTLALPVDCTPTSPSRPSQVPQLVEEMKEYFNDLDLLLEYKLLYVHHYPGVYVIPSLKSLHEWHGVIFVRSGPFRSGIFRFTIYIPDGYPHLRPMVKFHSRVSHPYVHADNGALNLLRGFPPWEPSNHHIWHVVHYTAECFYRETTWEEEESEDFEVEAKACATESIRKLHDPSSNEGGHLVSFKNLDDKAFQDILLTMAKGEMPHPPEAQPTLLAAVTDHFKQWWKGFT